MTDYHAAWLETLHQRDLFYLYALAIAATGYMLYRWYLRRWFRRLVAVLILIVLAEIAWGIYQPLPATI